MNYFNSNIFKQIKIQIQNIYQNKVLMKMNQKNNLKRMQVFLIKRDIKNL